LVEKFDFSEKQAQAILEMQLQKLTGLEILKLEEELKELLKRIEDYEAILKIGKKGFSDCQRRTAQAEGEIRRRATHGHRQKRGHGA